MIMKDFTPDCTVSTFDHHHAEVTEDKSPGLESRDADVFVQSHRKLLKTQINQINTTYISN